MVSQFLLVVAIYRSLDQDAFIRETISMEVCCLLQNRRFFPHFKIGGFVSFSKSAVLSHLQNRRFFSVSEICSFVSFKIRGSNEESPPPPDIVRGEILH